MYSDKNPNIGAIDIKNAKIALFAVCNPCAAARLGLNSTVLFSTIYNLVLLNYTDGIAANTADGCGVKGFFEDDSAS